MKALLCAVAASLLVASSAHANAIDDANAGLEALNVGDADHALQLFNRAIATGDLHGDDLEFAYASRGRAYLKLGNLSEAIADLDHARRMKPDDTDAQNDLVSALSAKLPADQMPGLPKASIWSQLGQAALQGVVAGLQGDNQ